MVRVLLGILVFVFSPLKADTLTSPFYIPEKLDVFINRFLESERQNHLFPVAKNIEGECAIEKIYLLFDYYGTIDIPAARKMIVEVVQTFLKKINFQAEEFSCYFASFPLTPCRLDIRIRIRNPSCTFNYPTLGNIAYVTAADGLVSYGTLNSYTFKMNNLRLESFSQAAYLSSFYP